MEHFGNYFNTNYSGTVLTSKDDYELSQEEERVQANYLKNLVDRQNYMEQIEISLFQNFKLLENSFHKISSHLNELELLKRELNVIETRNDCLEPEKDTDRSQLLGNDHPSSYISELNHINNTIPMKSLLNDSSFTGNHYSRLEHIESVNKSNISHVPTVFYETVITPVPDNVDYYSTYGKPISCNQILQNDADNSLNTIPKLLQNQIQSSQIYSGTSNELNSNILINSHAHASGLVFENDVNQLPTVNSRYLDLLKEDEHVNVTLHNNSVGNLQQTNFMMAETNTQCNSADMSGYQLSPEKLMPINQVAGKTDDLVESPAQSNLVNENEVVVSENRIAEDKTQTSSLVFLNTGEDMAVMSDKLVLPNKTISVNHHILPHGSETLSIKLQEDLKLEKELLEKDIELINNSTEVENRNKESTSEDDEQAKASVIICSKTEDVEEMLPSENKDVVLNDKVLNSSNTDQLDENTILHQVENEGNLNPQILENSIENEDEKENESTSSVESKGEPMEQQNHKNINNEKKELENFAVTSTKLKSPLDNRRKTKIRRKSKARKDSILARKSSQILSEESSESGVSQNLPLTSSAAYKSLIIGMPVIPDSSKPNVDSESESEDDVEIALRMAMQKKESVSKLEDSPAKSSPPELLKVEDIPKTKPVISQQSKFVDGQKQSRKSSLLPQTGVKPKLTKASRIALGLDSESDSAPIQSSIKKDDNEESDEFDFFN